jgi:hypothetical protein
MPTSSVMQLTDVIQLALQVHVFAIRQQVERILAG